MGRDERNGLSFEWFNRPDDLSANVKRRSKRNRSRE